MKGLVHAQLLDGQGGAQTLTADQALAWQPGQGVLWLHLDYTLPDAESWLTHHGVSPLIAEALLTQETRPRASLMRDGTLVYLRGVNLTPGAQPEDMIAVRLWVTPERIISTQRRPLRAVADMLSDLSEGAGPTHAHGLLVSLIDRLTWNMEDVVDQVEDQIGGYEEVGLLRQSRAVRNDIGRVRRRVSVLRRYLAPQRDALSRLLDASGPLGDTERGLLREVLDRLLRLLEDLDTAREHATIAQEDLSNRLADDLNRRMYILAVVSIIFLPLGVLTGLLGVNLAGIPASESPYAFAGFVGILLTVVAGISLVLKRNRWL
ncbi:zinc transporter ZntB [Alcanivorax sp. JB21]|uniref:CorA family divalent cation transporter n=1 Tax=Alcanivorax limicola TaxID=2874102 RepID=UPI001CBA834B|nr:CorA family divalent cation transporter [Alcanivorax limicola]MBZ2187975.1 zinc transporter ZntB [Alcanivorax limicola]